MGRRSVTRRRGGISDKQPVDVAKKDRCATGESCEWMKKSSGRWRDCHVTLGVLGVRSWPARQKVSVRKSGSDNRIHF